MGERTQKNIYESFVGESKAYHRLLAFSRKADQEDFTQIARLFRAVASAEGVHAERHLRLLGEGIVKETEQNLKTAFESETSVNAIVYPKFIREAEEEDHKAAALTFSQARDVEEGHAALYKEAMHAMLHGEIYDYHVCNVCGYVAKKSAPDICPICDAERGAFDRVT